MKDLISVPLMKQNFSLVPMKNGEYLTDISEKISERINLFIYELLDYLDTIPLSQDPMIHS